MIGTLIWLIALVIILGVVWWAIMQLLPLIPLPAPFGQIVYVLLVVILVIIVVYVILTLLSGLPTGAGLHWGRL
jgi:hypothetical protein